MRRFATTVLATTALLIGGLGLQPASAAGYPPCTITGTASGETITGTEGIDVICTGGGNDTVNALDGNDIIIVSGSGIDTINGGSGNDTVDASLGTDSTIDAGAGDDTVYGTPGDDEITAGDGSDTVYGQSGSDYLTGGEGSDTLVGAEGDDSIYSGSGNDQIFGDAGDDRLSGGEGSDQVVAGSGWNTCTRDSLDVFDGCSVYVTVDDWVALNFSGVVTDSSGKPIPGVCIDTLEGSNGSQVITNSSGSYRGTLRVIRGQTVSSTIILRTCTEASMNFFGRPLEWQVTGEPFTTDHDLVINLQLPKLSSVKIHVSDAGGKPVKTGFVTSENILIGKSSGINDGAIRNTNVALNSNGDAIIPVFAGTDPGISSFGVSYMDSTGVWNGKSFDLDISSELGYVTVDDWVALNFSGVVTDSSGKPIPGVCIDTLEGSNGSQVITNSSGSYRGTLRVIRGQTVSSTIFLRTCTEASMNFFGRPLEWHVTGEPFTTDHDLVINLQLPKLSSVKIHVSDAGGKPVKTGFVTSENILIGKSSGINDGVIRNTNVALNSNGDAIIPVFAGTDPGISSFFVSYMDSTGVWNGKYFDLDISSVTTQSVSLLTMPSKLSELQIIKVTTNSATLSWPKPSATEKVSNYVVDASLDGTLWTPVSKKASNSNTLSLSGLKIGATYQVRVAAVNSAGTGSYVYGSFNTLATVSTSPTALVSSNLSSSGFSLNWNAPSSNGGAAITDYLVEINGGGFNWTPVAHSPSISTSMNITGLNPGVKYSVRVKAVNSVGVSKASSTLSVTTMAVLPSSPVVTLKSVTATGAVLNWVVPANGGAKISDYKVEYSTDGGNTWLTVLKSASTSTSLTLKNLKTRTSYLFRVSAKNSVGYGALSQNLAVTTS